MTRRASLILVGALWLLIGWPAEAQTIWVPGGTATGIGNNTSNGYVGIGTSAPIQHLHVTSSHNPSTGIILENTAAGGRQYAFVSTQDAAGIGGGKFSIYDLTGWVHRFTITSTGNVGIGTPWPAQLFHVHENSTARGGVSFSNTDASADEEFFKIHFDARDSTGGSENYAAINAVIVDPTNGSEDGRLNFETRVNGSSDVRLTINGANVGIGTATPSHKLAVNGTIRAKEVIVDSGWADHVFSDDYRLARLDEVAAHIRHERRLPGLPSAEQVAEQGVNVAEMQRMLLEKVEELTLHVIELSRANARQDVQIEQLKAENTALRNRRPDEA